MLLITLEDRILYFNPGRRLDPFKLNKFFQAVDHHPGVAAGRLNRFADFSILERVDVDASIVRYFTKIRSAAAATQRPSKAVLFSNQPLGLELAWMLETHLLSDHIQCRAMHNFDEALEWLHAGDLKASILNLRHYP
jgi:hypothetical protein